MRGVPGTAPLLLLLVGLIRGSVCDTGLEGENQSLGLQHPLRRTAGRRLQDTSGSSNSSNDFWTIKTSDGGPANANAPSSQRDTTSCDPIPLYRGYDALHRHVDFTDLNEFTNLTLDYVLGRICSNPIAGTQPLYRVFAPVAWLLSWGWEGNATSASLGDFAGAYMTTLIPNESGWLSSLTLGYVSPTNATGGIPLYRADFDNGPKAVADRMSITKPQEIGRFSLDFNGAPMCYIIPAIG